MCWGIYILTPNYLDTNAIVLPPRHRKRVPALGNHPGTRGLPGYRRSGLRLAAGPDPGFCACRHWASRTRAVSLLTGGYTPLLALYLMKRKYPKQSIAKSRWLGSKQ